MSAGLPINILLYMYVLYTESNNDLSPASYNSDNISNIYLLLFITIPKFASVCAISKNCMQPMVYYDTNTAHGATNKSKKNCNKKVEV